MPGLLSMGGEMVVEEKYSKFPIQRQLLLVFIHAFPSSAASTGVGGNTTMPGAPPLLHV